MKLFHEFIAHHALSTPERKALVVHQHGVNYGQLYKMSCAIADLLSGHKIHPHERVVVYAPTTIESIAAMLGVLQSESILVLGRHGFCVDQLIHQLNDVQASVLLVEENEDVTYLLEQIPIRLVIRFSRTHGEDGWLNAASYDHALTEPDLPAVSPDDKARAIFFTSGSTSSAKAVVISNKNMLSAYSAVTSYLDISDQAVILNPSAIHCDYGFYNIMMPLFAGGVSITQSFFSLPIETVLDIMVAERVTGAHLAPSFISRLLKAAPSAIKNLSQVGCLRYIASSAQALPDSYY